MKNKIILCVALFFVWNVSTTHADDDWKEGVQNVKNFLTGLQKDSPLENFFMTSPALYGNDNFLEQVSFYESLNEGSPLPPPEVYAAMDFNQLAGSIKSFFQSVNNKLIGYYKKIAAKNKQKTSSSMVDYGSILERSVYDLLGVGAFPSEDIQSFDMPPARKHAAVSAIYASHIPIIVP